VLLAEDDPVNQTVAMALLADTGLNIDVVADGRDAVARATATPYDLILMDVQMSQMDGLEATRAIRALPQRAHTPILAMTANAFEEDRRRCIDAGMNDFIAKPVDPDTMFGKILRWLSASDAEGALQPRGAGRVPDSVRHTLQALESLLAIDDSRADGLYQERAASLRACLPAAAMAPLQRQMDAFDFPAALQTVRRALEAFGQDAQ
jgi:CheY-like chemotaxis protein